MKRLGFPLVKTLRRIDISKDFQIFLTSKSSFFCYTVIPNSIYNSGKIQNVVL